MIDVDYNEYKATLEDNMRLIQENHKLKEKVKEWQDISTRINEDNNRLNNIINKAIEYIEEHITEDSEYENYMQCKKEEKEELLEILKGE